MIVKTSRLGQFDPMQILGLGYNKLTVKSRFFPPIDMDLTSPTSPETKKLLEKTQLSFSLSGPAGKINFAPYGEPTGIDPQVKQWAIAIGLGLGAALLGTMVLGKVLL